MRGAIVTLVLLSATAQAGAKQDAAEGARLLKELQEEQAIAVLTRALDRGDATKAEEAELALLLGLARFNLRDEEGARLAFKRGLVADGSAELPKLASPRARALFVQVKAAVDDERAKARAAAAQSVAAPPAAVEVTQPPSSGGPSARQVSGVVLAVAGVAAAAVGGWAIGDAYSQRSAAVKEPDALTAKSLFDTGQSRLTLGTVLVIAGGVVLVGGAAIFFWPSSDTPAASVSWVWLGNGFGLRGRF